MIAGGCCFFVLLSRPCYRWKESIANEDYELKVNKFVQWKFGWIHNILCNSQIILITINFAHTKFRHLQAIPNEKRMRFRLSHRIACIIHVCAGPQQWKKQQKKCPTECACSNEKYAPASLIVCCYEKIYRFCLNFVYILLVHVIV